MFSYSDSDLNLVCEFVRFVLKNKTTGLVNLCLVVLMFLGLINFLISMIFFLRRADLLFW